MERRCIAMVVPMRHERKGGTGKAMLASALLLMMGAQEGMTAELKLWRFTDLPGWAQADHALALAAFRRSCQAMLKPDYYWRDARYGGTIRDWQAVCRAALKLPEKVSGKQARDFFEQHFHPVSTQMVRKPSGLFTGYYEPEVEGSLKRQGPYQVPLHGRPDDLVRLKPEDAKRLGVAYGRYVKGRARPYYTREQIERGALKGRGLEIVWLKDAVERFFMQIQGSGRVRLPDGRVLRLAFAGKTGHPFTGIGRLLIERGIIPREKLSMQSLKRWMRANPKQARKLMWENRSYVFFRIVDLPDARLGAYGAQGVQLTPLASLAVDYRYWPYGAPVWLETTAPRRGGGQGPFRRLMVAQDTGTAIRGKVRGDIFYGFGDAAGALAGRQKAPGFMAVLLPRPLAARLTGKMSGDQAGADTQKESPQARPRKRGNWNQGRMP